MRFHPTAALAALLAPSLVSAWAAPVYSDLRLIWQETFGGASGSKVNEGNWNYITNINVNAELQRYTTETRNVQLSGGDTLQIVPWWNAGSPGEWTSGRLESKYVFTPGAGTRTVAEARLRFGSNPVTNKKGIWPAFWLLGDSIRHGTGWPACGELDIMETVNGILTGHGTVHCDVYPGGICNEGTGIANTIAIPDQGWHTWRIQWDRRAGGWQNEVITWSMDGKVFHTVTGGRIGNENVWRSLCQSPVFFILNVAVGGTWPGYPDTSTWDGYGSMMEVAYVAHYVQN